METMETNLVPTKYSCKLCDYNTSRYSQYSRHLNTAKHITQAKNSKPELLVPNDSSVFICSQCKKMYKNRSGLWKHAKICFIDEKVLNLPEDEKYYLEHMNKQSSNWSSKVEIK